MKNIFLVVLFSTILFTSCTNTIGVVEDEKIEVAETRSLPDLSPEHSTGSTSYLPNATKEIVVRIRNFGASSTTAPVVFDITKMVPIFTLTFDSTATSYTPAATTFSLNNEDWSVQEQATRYRFTSKTGVVIGPGEVAYIGIKLTAGTNGNASLNTRVISGTGGGETPTSNNLKITHMSISN